MKKDRGGEEEFQCEPKNKKRKTHEKIHKRPNIGGLQGGTERAHEATKKVDQGRTVLG